MTITVYCKPNCPQCDLTKRDMDILGIDYEIVDITLHRAELHRLVAMGYKQVPVVETGTDAWSGHDPDKIKALMQAA